MTFKFTPLDIRREELETIYGLPVFCYYSIISDEMVYRTRGGFAGNMVIGTLPNAATDYAKFLDKECELMEKQKPEDWSI